MVSARADFAPVHEAMDRYVDAELLPGVSISVLVGGEVVDSHFSGWADREAGIRLGERHIFRMFSNTKLITSCAALMLLEEGRFALDDPIEAYIPALGDRQVLRPGATDISDTEPARGSITIRHLMTHTSGLVYDFTDPDSLLCRTYAERNVRNPAAPVSEMVNVLAGIPLAFHPGTAWEYSFATDVVGRLIEVVSGRTLGEFVRERILDPLGMDDTGFWVPEEKHDRFARLYAGADLEQPMRPGLTVMAGPAYDDVYLKPKTFESGGGGMVSTLPDTVALLRALMSGDGLSLKPETMRLVTASLLPKDMWVRFAGIGELVGKGHSAACGVSVGTLPREHPGIAGECYWGGLAGTQWWMSPPHGLAAAIMTQRHMAWAHPFAAELKNLVYRAVLG